MFMQRLFLAFPSLPMAASGWKHSAYFQHNRFALQCKLCAECNNRRCSERHSFFQHQLYIHHQYVSDGTLDVISKTTFFTATLSLPDWTLNSLLSIFNYWLGTIVYCSHRRGSRQNWRCSGLNWDPIKGLYLIPSAKFSANSHHAQYWSTVLHFSTL